MERCGEYILNEICYMKHNIEFRKCVEELIGLRINTFINLSYNEVKGMIYIDENKKRFSLNYHRIDCSCYQISNLIKKKEINYSMFILCYVYFLFLIIYVICTFIIFQFIYESNK